MLTSPSAETRGFRGVQRGASRAFPWKHWDVDVNMGSCVRLCPARDTEVWENAGSQLVSLLWGRPLENTGKEGPHYYYLLFKLEKN